MQIKYFIIVDFFKCHSAKYCREFQRGCKNRPPYPSMSGFEREHLRAVFVYAKIHEVFCLLLVKLPGLSQLESFQVLLVKYNPLL